MYKYFIELLGVVTILYAKLLTDGNPAVMGVVYFAMFTIAYGITTSYFSPLSGVASYFLGHMTYDDLIYNLIAQTLGTALVIISFKPVQMGLK
jgi:hypothetical protein